MYIEMHAHSQEYSSCASIAMRDLVKEYSTIGVDGLCITEHNVFADSQTLEKLAIEFDICLFPGIEWSMPEGHFLIFGLHSLRCQEFAKKIDQLKTRADRLIRLHESISYSQIRQLDQESLFAEKPPWPDKLDDLISMVHNRSGVIIWAHPMDNFSVLRKRYNEYVGSRQSVQMAGFIEFLEKKYRLLLQCLGAMDALEIRNGFDNQLGLENYLAEQLAHELGLPSIGSSDAHKKDMVGLYTTCFPNRLENIGDLVAAIKRREIGEILDKQALKRKVRQKRRLDDPLLQSILRDISEKLNKNDQIRLRTLVTKIISDQKGTIKKNLFSLKGSGNLEDQILDNYDNSLGDSLEKPILEDRTLEYPAIVDHTLVDHTLEDHTVETKLSQLVDFFRCRQLFFPQKPSQQKNVLYSLKEFYNAKH